MVEFVAKRINEIDAKPVVCCYVVSINRVAKRIKEIETFFVCSYVVSMNRVVRRKLEIDAKKVFCCYVVSRNTVLDETSSVMPLMSFAVMLFPEIMLPKER